MVEQTLGHCAPQVQVKGMVKGKRDVHTLATFGTNLPFHPVPIVGTLTKLQSKANEP